MNRGWGPAFTHVVDLDKTLPTVCVNDTDAAFGMKSIVPALDTHDLGEALDVFDTEKLEVQCLIDVQFLSVPGVGATLQVLDLQ
jgi:hypothetical protein